MIFCRHKEDDRANKRIVSVVKKWGNCDIKSEAIKVGDIIHLKEDQEVPCDAIVLSTSHTQVRQKGAYNRIVEFGNR